MNNILPNGTELRDLLSNSFLTTAHINKLLKDKGIVTQNSDKNASFPIYMSLLLSPEEFIYLYEKNTENRKSLSNKMACTGTCCDGTDSYASCFAEGISK